MIIPFQRDGYDEIVCCVCGLSFHVPDMWVVHRRARGGGFWCPNGDNIRFFDPDAPAPVEPEPEPKKKWWRFWR